MYTPRPVAPNGQYALAQLTSPAGVQTTSEHLIPSGASLRGLTARRLSVAMVKIGDARPALPVLYSLEWQSASLSEEEQHQNRGAITVAVRGSATMHVLPSNSLLHCTAGVLQHLQQARSQDHLQLDLTRRSASQHQRQASAAAAALARVAASEKMAASAGVCYRDTNARLSVRPEGTDPFGQAVAAGRLLEQPKLLVGESKNSTLTASNTPVKQGTRLISGGLGGMCHFLLQTLVPSGFYVVKCRCKHAQACAIT